MKRKSIFVTGASGTVGIQVLSLLVQDGRYDVTAFDIRTKRSAKLLRKYEKAINVVYGDITDANQVEKSTKGVDVVIHLAALIPPAAEEHPDLAYKINVNGTENLLNAIKKESPNAFFIYASSISIYGDRVADPMIRTTDRLRPSPQDNYGETKMKAEGLVQASGIRWSIFRLAAIMGGGNHKIGRLMFEMPLKTSLEIVSPRDTARAFVNGIEKQTELKGRIFNLGGGEKNRISYEEFLSRAFNISGLGKLDFPDYAFAEHNFHCGLCADGDELENIVHFRHDTLDDFFDEMHKDIGPIKRFFARLFSWAVKRHLLSLSPPANAFKKRDKLSLARFFKFNTQQSDPTHSM